MNNTKIEWSKESVLALIQSWEEFECLYNPRNEFYHNKHARNNALDTIAKELDVHIKNLTRNEIKTKINYLRSQYCRELSKIKGSYKSGIGFNDIYTPTAYWFDQLRFLREHVTVKKGISSVPMVNDVDVSDITFEDTITVPTISARRKKKHKTGDILLEDDLLIQAKALLENLAQPYSDRYTAGLLLFLEENICEVRDQSLRDELSEKIIAIVMEYKRKERQLGTAK